MAADNAKVKERGNSFSKPEPIQLMGPQNNAVFETSLEDTFISFWLDFAGEKTQFSRQKELKMFDLLTAGEKKLLQVSLENSVLRFKYL